MRRSLLLLLLLLACRPALAATCDVDASFDRQFQLRLSYACDPGVRRFILHEPQAVPYAHDATLADGIAPARDDDYWVVPAKVPAARPIRFSYRVDLSELAGRVNNTSAAVRIGDSILSPVSNWLVEPIAEKAAVTIRLKVTPPGGYDFAAGLGPSDGGSSRIDGAAVWTAGYAAFGRLRRAPIELPYPSDRGGRAVLQVVHLDGRFELGDAAIDRWIASRARAVADYYGGFPAKDALLVAVPVPGDRVRFGRVLPGAGIAIMMQIGTQAKQAALDNDWVLVHELTHTGMPFLYDRGGWFMEGAATYIEPIIRARAGWRSPQSVWEEFHDGMPRGLTAMTEGGLASAGIGGMYWGGAIFMLLADLEIRRTSDGRRGLEDCLRTVLWQDGNASLRWTADKMIAACDAAIGHPVLAPLAERYRRRGNSFDLDALWRELGVEAAADGVRLRDDAPAARWREAIIRDSAG